MKYYLIDLERSIRTGVVHYWKGNLHGYTRDLDVAGLFTEEQTNQIVKDDFDKNTIAVSTEQVRKIHE